MAFNGPDSQRRYFPQQQSGSNSTTNLLHPQQPISDGRSASAPHPKYAQRPPSLRAIPSTSSLVCTDVRAPDRLFNPSRIERVSVQ